MPSAPGASWSLCTKWPSPEFWLIVYVPQTGGVTLRPSCSIPRPRFRWLGLDHDPKPVFASPVHGRLGFVAELIAGACNIAVTLLLYDIFRFRPVNRSLSLLAAFFGLVASTAWTRLPHPESQLIARC